MSDTPRTDAAKNRRGIEGDAWIRADFARELERELARLTAERDEARREVFKALKELFTTAGLRHELVRRGWWDWYREVRP